MPYGEDSGINYGIGTDLLYKLMQGQTPERYHMVITNIKTLGEGIRARRKALGYTQGFLSEATGLSVSFISDLERGKETAEIGKVLRLIHLLGMDLTMTPRD